MHVSYILCKNAYIPEEQMAFVFFFNRHLLSLPLSLSEEELLRMRQELHCCFSQVDSSLAWPKIRARTLLQAFEVEWRDTELLKVDQNLAMTNKQVGTMWDQRGDVQGDHRCIHMLLALAADTGP